MKPLKIGMLTDNYPFTGAAIGSPPGGIGTYTQSVGEELARRGHEVHVICQANVPALRSLMHNGLRLWQCPLWSRRREMGLRQAAAFTLKHNAEARRLTQFSLAEGVRQAAGGRPFDVLESPEFAALGALVEKKDAALLAVRLHGAVHQHMPMTEALREDWFFQAERELAARADVITAATQSVLAQSRERWRLPLAQAVVVPNPAVEMPAAADGAERGADFTAVCFGRLDERKGVDILAQAACLVARREPRFRLTFIGADVRWGDGRMGSQMIREIAARQGAEGAISVLPPQDRAALGAAVRGAAVAVFPSRGEAFGIAVIEAMLSGTPCVVSDIPAFVEVSQQGRQARLFADGSAEALAEALLADLRDEAGRRARAAGARQYAQRYLPDQIVPLVLAAWGRGGAP